MPLAVIAMAVIFNTGNAYLNGQHLFNLSASMYTTQWLQEPRFIIGIGLFIIGFIVNRWADHVLRRLRKPGEAEYQVPKGGLYRYVSCPNYFGEIIEWIGWAVATWSLAGLAFAVWTIANLTPRARSHHHWYRKVFSDYPPKRKALIPGIW